MIPRLAQGWNDRLDAEFEQPYMHDLERFVARERSVGGPIYPPSHQVFRALQLTEFEEVRVVIIGQDPYHGAGQANGLAFSVSDGMPLPPSLRNIFKEAGMVGENGDLERWAGQGVLLLNTVLTVREGSPGSHQGHGWERFTDVVVNRLNEREEPVVFLLWGRHARAKGTGINGKQHHVLEAPHPSPLSAHKGFFGRGHFATTNQLLAQIGRPPINWC